jgi:hypothetical protein
MKYTQEKREKVDAWLNDPTIQRIVEQDLGTPIRVKVQWAKGTIRVMGPRFGKELQIQDILDACETRQ